MADLTALGHMVHAEFEAGDKLVRLVDSASIDDGCRLFAGSDGARLNVHHAQHLLRGLAEWLHEHHPEAGPESQVWDILRPEDEAEVRRG